MITSINNAEVKPIYSPNYNCSLMEVPCPEADQLGNCNRDPNTKCVYEDVKFNPLQDTIFHVRENDLYYIHYGYDWQFIKISKEKVDFLQKHGGYNEGDIVPIIEENTAMIMYLHVVQENVNDMYMIRSIKK